MYTNIMPILRCPHCGTGFELVESQIEIEEIVEGKIRFISANKEVLIT